MPPTLWLVVMVGTAAFIQRAPCPRADGLTEGKASPAGLLIRVTGGNLGQRDQKKVSFCFVLFCFIFTTEPFKREFTSEQMGVFGSSWF